MAPIRCDTVSFESGTKFSYLAGFSPYFILCVISLANGRHSYSPIQLQRLRHSESRKAQEAAQYEASCALVTSFDSVTLNQNLI